MKQLLFPLLLFPLFALAQYPGNANQKITLGEQTTADGLVYRGVASIDTVTATSKITRANKQDTSAFLLLDTVTNLLWHYKIGSNAWKQAGGGDTSLIAYVNTYGTQTVNGAKTFTSELTATRFNPTANTETGTGMFLPAANTLGFSTNGTNRMTLNASGNLSIGNTNNTYKLDVTGKGLFENNSNSAHELIIKNTTAGSNSEAYLYVISDNSAGSTTLGKFSSTTTPFKIIGASNAYWFNGIAGDIAIINNYGSGAIKLAAGGSSSAHLTIASTGAATFSSSVTATTGIFTNYIGGGTTPADIDNTGQIVRTSSIELKKDISNIKYGLNEILQIKPINFNWKNEDKFGNENENGFIAEDVINIIPNVIGSDANGIFMSYNKLIPILTKAIQEQNALIKALEQRILNLENK